MRSKLWRLSLVSVGFFSMLQTPASYAADAPNVVLIYIDDLGYGDLGCYGAEDIPTPNIDKLAEEGVRCTASHITNPPCCPSRCALLMGQYAQRFGKYGMSRGLPIPEDRPTLAKWLTTHGYQTGQIGKWDVGTSQQGPLAVGFTSVRRNPPRKRYTAREIEAAPAALQQQLRKNKGTSKYFCIDANGESVWLTDFDGDSMVEFVDEHHSEPFFLYWSPEAVHSFNTEVPHRLAKRTSATGKRRKLGGAIVAVDDQVGKLIDALERHQLRDKTLIIFSSDNGANGSDGGSSAPYAGGKGGGTQKEGWVRVPTILSMPGVLPEGTEYHGLVANFDFYSTIAELCVGEVPDHCDGVDLLALLKSESDKPAHEYLYWLNNEPGDAVRRHMMAVRWQDWRLYRKYADDPWQLFDLKADPREQNNLAGEQTDLVDRLAQRHAAWTETLAPLATIPDQQRGQQTIPKGYGWASRSE